MTPEEAQQEADRLSIQRNALSKQYANLLFENKPKEAANLKIEIDFLKEKIIRLLKNT